MAWKAVERLGDLITKPVQITKIIAYVGKPQWLHTLIHPLLQYLLPISGVLISGWGFVGMGTLAGQPQVVRVSMRKEDFKKPMSISMFSPKLPIPHAHLLHKPVISPSDSKVSHPKLHVIICLRGSYEFNECHQDLNDKSSWQAIPVLQNRKNF